ncbi:MAG: UDP-N-acetylglucosamine--LPS N-acetylglucosamine transferase [Pseudomonadota bacterium]
MASFAAVPKVLAVSSGGGHWAELLRLRPAWEGADVVYVVTQASYRCDLTRGGKGTRYVRGFYTVPDANKDQKLRLLAMAIKMAVLVLLVRPDVVVSTGAAPGYVAIRFGKWLGARTVWVDSIANADEMSLAGRLAKPHADLWMSQWPDLSERAGAVYAGAVM